MFELNWPWALLFLPLPIVVYYLLKQRSNPETALHVPFFDTIKTLANNKKISHQYRWWQISLAWISWFSLIFAACQPQWVKEENKVPLSGRDLMLVVDISGSMGNLYDIINQRRVSRLRVVKEVLKEFIEKRQGDRLGLVVFGTYAYVQAPLTFDYKTVQIMLEETETDLAGKATAIGDAIGLTIKNLQENNTNNKQVIILLSDGTSNSDTAIKPIQAAMLAQENDLTIYTVGIGHPRNRELDEYTLREIASITGGQYFLAKNKNELNNIYDELDKIEPIQKENKVFRTIESLYYWPLSGSLAISMLLLFFSYYRVKHN